MRKFYLEATPKTPKLSFDGDNGVFEISGRSIPENSIEFYREALKWLDNYIAEPCNKTVVLVKLEYFNTSSSKCIIDIFRKLEKISGSHSIEVKWFYEDEDEDMMESGEEFKEIIKLPISMIRVEAEEN